MNSSNSSLEPNPYAVQKNLEEIMEKRNISEPLFIFLVIMYIVLIFVGSTGNFLVVFAVFRNKQMRTARWVFELFQVNFTGFY